MTFPCNWKDVMKDYHYRPKKFYSFEIIQGRPFPQFSHYDRDKSSTPLKYQSHTSAGTSESTESADIGVQGYVGLPLVEKSIPVSTSIVPSSSGVHQFRLSLVPRESTDPQLGTSYPYEVQTHRYTVLVLKNHLSYVLYIRVYKVSSFNFPYVVKSYFINIIFLKFRCVGGACCFKLIIYFYLEYQEVEENNKKEVDVKPEFMSTYSDRI